MSASRTTAASLAAAVLVAAAVACVLVAMLAWPASAHISGIAPSRSANGNVVYKCFSNNYCGSYNWSNDQWSGQAYKPDITPYGSNTTATSLRVVEDVSYPNVTWAAIWDSNPSADEIVNNKYFMSEYGTNTLRVVSTHELGHSVGFGHASAPDANDDDYYCRNAVMYPNVNSAFRCGQDGYLMQHDRRDWNLAWGGNP